MVLSTFKITDPFNYLPKKNELPLVAIKSALHENFSKDGQTGGRKRQRAQVAGKPQGNTGGAGQGGCKTQPCRWGTASDLHGQVNPAHLALWAAPAPSRVLTTTSDQGASSSHTVHIRPGGIRASLLYAIIFLIVTGTSSMGMEFSRLGCQPWGLIRYQAITS